MKWIILGGGCAGLSFANILKQKGIDSFIVIEKEKTAGGLCRSTIVDESPFDIGGGHFLDVKRKKVNDFLFGFMPEQEWNLFSRDSRIIVNGYEVAHPIEANIWQMDLDNQVAYLKSIAMAGCNTGEPMPNEFVKWIYWKLGKRIAEDYMLPYNQKMFHKELQRLGTYWLDKLPNVSFDETLRSCLEKKPYGTQPGHASFYYPKKYGYGEVWTRMEKELGDKIILNSRVKEINFEELSITTSNNEKFHADIIVTTIPWTVIERFVGLPGAIEATISNLKYSSIETRYYSEKLNTDAHWVYYPDLSLPYHRILVRSNFCIGSRGYWTETNSERIQLIPEKDGSIYNYMNEYAYPLNTTDKPRIMNSLLGFCETKNVFGLGRWGEWQHYNSDVTVEKAMQLAERLINT